MGLLTFNHVASLGCPIDQKILYLSLSLHIGRMDFIHFNQKRDLMETSSLIVNVNTLRSGEAGGMNRASSSNVLGSRLKLRSIFTNITSLIWIQAFFDLAKKTSWMKNSKLKETSKTWFYKLPAASASLKKFEFL